MRKICAKCGIEKSLSGFHTNGTHVDGSPVYRNICKVCRGKKVSEDRIYKRMHQHMTDYIYCNTCRRFFKKSMFNHCKKCKGTDIIPAIHASNLKLKDYYAKYRQEGR